MKTTPLKLDFSISGLQKSGAALEAASRISVSGVQEKFPVVVDGGVVRLAREGERSTHILKPAPWDETIDSRKYIPVNEHLTMQIASKVYGIRTAENALCLSADGQMAYVTKRFDIAADGSKLEMEDFASVVGRSEQTDGQYFKYSGSYEEIATGIRKNVSAWMVDTERLFDLIVFNYIYGNGDDHLKNFSLVRKGEDYRLAPAYDLLNTSLHVGGDDFGLDGGLSPNLVRSDVYGQTGHPCRVDFERFAQIIGIKPVRAARILNRYAAIPGKALDMAEASPLTEKLKRQYLRVVRERTARFNRLSE